MQNSYYPLDAPVEKITISQIVKFTITNMNIALFNTASMNAMLYNDTDVIVDGMYFTLTPEQYAEWSRLGDEYLIALVKELIRIKYAKKEENILS
jgi:hypothetical protein